MPLPERVSDLAAYDLLLSVSRLGSVGAAARAHGISQPSASSRLRHLERRLGLQLLERSPRGSRLTEQGALVAGWARTAVDAAAFLDAGVTSLLGTTESRLQVAASMTVAEYLLPQWLAALRARAPHTSVALTAGNSDEVAAAVREGRAHLGFVEAPDVPRGLTARTVGRDELTVIVAPAHPWAGRRSGITADELSATPLVSRERGSGTRRYLERALDGVGAVPLAAPLLELPSTTAIKTAVADGVAPAVLSSLALTAELANGTVVAVPVRDLDLTRALRLVHPRTSPPTGAAGELAAIARHDGPPTAA
ncbi:LysR family transcriptional regulator [Streptomyces sp. NPDC088354]|uniref:LysR family transcriptional regulator n=1 Tax=unclassified Streptomyces TaxID=2593676 RepID=UPI0029ACC10C|nr:LysR family transcriptional regulator [Streptomyces sp. MI02-7b]MDX3072920.1 LysR family transcriptional regulator [Streptomyces sp. MI02-7b]